MTNTDTDTDMSRRDLFAIEMFKILIDKQRVVDLIKVEDVGTRQFAIYDDALFFMRTAYSLADEMIHASDKTSKGEK